MAQIYKVDNYIITEEAGVKIDFSSGKTVYIRNSNGGADKIEIVDNGDSARVSARISILISDIVAGNWEDNLAVVYTEATFLAFLRISTGFNAQGSDASKEDKANKQNNLTIDGTGTKYPTVDAINLAPFKWTIDLTGVLTGEIYPNFAGTIASVTDLVGTPVTTILLNGAAYTLTNPIASGDRITITVDVISVIDLNFTVV